MTCEAPGCEREAASSAATYCQRHCEMALMLNPSRTTFEAVERALHRRKTSTGSADW